MLLELQDHSQEQLELHLEADSAPDKSELMIALDAMNQKFGKGTLHMASAGMAGDRRVWNMKQERRTPQYTTKMGDILSVKA
jgi:DNA polymerase V